MAWARRFQQRGGASLSSSSSIIVIFGNRQQPSPGVGLFGFGILGFKGLLVGLGAPPVLWFWAGLFCSRVHLWMVDMGYDMGWGYQMEAAPSYHRRCMHSV